MKKSSLTFIVALTLLASMLAGSSANAEPVATHLSEVDFAGIKQGWGKPTPDASVGGADLAVGGDSFEKGIGVHAEFTWKLNLDGKGVEFRAKAGMQDACPGLVEFIVRGDGRDLWRSGPMHGGEKAKEIKVALVGVKELELYVDPLGDTTSDHADWIDPVIVHNGAPLPPVVRPHTATDGIVDKNVTIWKRDNWNFSKLARPSKSAASANAKITILGRAATACMSPDALHNGVLPRGEMELRDFFAFSPDSAGGVILMDLGKTQPVAAVNSYSAGQDWQVDPQVFALYGSNAEKPDANKLDGPGWEKIADVDTRPNKTGDPSWRGYYATRVHAADGKLLGNFRWIAWAVRPTDSVTVPWWGQITPPAGKNVWRTQTWYCELDVHTPETLKTAGDAVFAGTQLKEVFVTHKTHYDIGYTHLAKEVVENYRTTMIDSALGIIDGARKLPPEDQFAWTVPGWPLWTILWPGQTPERRARVLQAIKEGRLTPHALPFSMHSESLEVEDLVWGLEFTAMVCREAGVPLTRAAKMTDVPSHTWIWPTLLKHAGINFLHIGANVLNMKPDVPILYFWQGPDGSRLLTMHSQGYGTQVQFGTGLYPPKDWPYPYWMAIIMTSDNQGPPDSGSVQAVMDAAKRDLPGVKVRFGKLEEFADAMLADPATVAKIPVVRADMPDQWIHGVGSMPAEETIARAARPGLASAEILDAHLRMWNLARPDLRDNLLKAHEQSLLYGEHTWGGNFGFIGGRHVYGEAWAKVLEKPMDGGRARAEISWNEHRDYIRNAAKIAGKISADAMSELASNVAVAGKRVVVFNPLPVKRDAWVDAAGEHFLARDLPPCGYKTFPLGVTGAPAPTRTDARNATLENKFLKVSIDQKCGGIVSIVDKRSGREMVPPNAETAFGQYLYERFSQRQCDDYFLYCYNWPVREWGGGFELCTRRDLPPEIPHARALAQYNRLTLETTPAGQRVVLLADATAALPAKVTTTISLPADTPWLEIAHRIDDKKPDPWPEAGWFALPVNVTGSAQFRVGRNAAVVNPATDYAYNSNHNICYVNTGAMIAGTDGCGLAVCPLDHGLMSFGKPGILLFEPDYVPVNPVAYINLFNNQWNTNFPFWIPGPFESRVRVWPVGNLNPASLVEPALEARFPVLTGIADGPAGKLPATAAGLSLSREGVRITRFAPNPDGPGTSLILWESVGQSGPLTVTLPGHFKTATPVDLRGEKTGEPVRIDAGKFAFDLPTYAPASYVLE
jgi:hypothetical protein